MSEVTIVIKDIEGEGKVNINVDFGDEGINENSSAHTLSVKMLRGLKGADEEDEEY